MFSFGAVWEVGERSSGGGERVRVWGGRLRGGMRGQERTETGAMVLGWTIASLGRWEDNEEGVLVLIVGISGESFSMLLGLVGGRSLRMMSRLWLKDVRSPLSKSSAEYMLLMLCSDTDRM